LKVCKSAVSRVVTRAEKIAFDSKLRLIENLRRTKKIPSLFRPAGSTRPFVKYLTFQFIGSARYIFITTYNHYGFELAYWLAQWHNLCTPMCRLDLISSGLSDHIDNSFTNFHPT